MVCLAFLKGSLPFVCHLYQWTSGEVMVKGFLVFPRRLFHLCAGSYLKLQVCVAEHLTFGGPLIAVACSSFPFSFGFTSGDRKNGVNMSHAVGHERRSVSFVPSAPDIESHYLFQFGASPWFCILTSVRYVQVQPTVKAVKMFGAT